MKNTFEVGDTKSFTHIVGADDLAEFESGRVHDVYGTFALGRDAEWTCRLFVLEMKDEHEEGIGTFLTIEHVSPALLGSTVEFEATVSSVKGNEIICSYVARVGERVIATGRQGQKIVSRDKLEKIFNSLR